MPNWLANLLSRLFHPIFMPLLGMFILFNSATIYNYRYQDNYKNIIYLLLLVNTILMPLLFSWVLKRNGIISSLEMKYVDERKWPYLFTFLMFLFTIWLFVQLNMAPLLLYFTLAAAISIFVLLVASLLKIKISAHLLSLGGLAGMLILLHLKTGTDMISVFSAIIIISGLVGTARLKLKAHTSLEIYTGFLIGLLTQLFLLY